MILEQVSYGLAIGSVYGLIAIGFSLVFKAAGLLNFACYKKAPDYYE